MSGARPPEPGFSSIQPTPTQFFGDFPPPNQQNNGISSAGYPPSSGYPYPNQTPFPIPTSYPTPTTSPSVPPNNMSTGYPGTTGYPTSPGYPNTGGYPSTGGYPNTGGTGGYPNTSGAGGYPNTGGYPGSGNLPGAISPTSGINPPPVCPTAPDLSNMEKIPGYDGLTFDETIVMPPSLPTWQPTLEDQKPLEPLPSFTEDQVHNAAIEYTSEHCCYGSGAAKNMVITNITMMSAFHYKLETFGEKRESAWRFEPYHGQAIDGPMNGPAPGPWDVVITPPSLFKDGKTKVEVPHTAYVKPCHTCIGNCRVRCDSCTGSGRSQCVWCKGRGRKSNFDNDRCDSCDATGFKRCTWCDATGQVKCKTCNGKGQLKNYVELVVTWTNHVDDYISETSSMPKELVRQVSGQTAFEDENYRVNPIVHSSDQAVVKASTEYVNKHNSAFPNERILKQRHCLRLVPIAQVNYQWNDNGGIFYVYGYEHKVYFENYPQKCCCCTIL